MYKLNLVANGYNFWRKNLQEKILTIFEYENLPENLPSYELEIRLLQRGYTAIFNHEKYGLVCCDGGGYGVDIYNHYTNYTYAQPVLGSGNLKIGEDCAIVYNTFVDKFGGSIENTMINRYAKALADIDSSINICVVNGRNTDVYTATDLKSAKEIELFFSNIQKGEYTSLKKEGVAMFENVGIIQNKEQRTGYLENLLNARRDMLANFYEEIGVSHKRNKVAEMTAYEVGEDRETLVLNQQTMLEMRREGLKMCNEIFGTDIKVRINEKIEREVLSNDGNGIFGE